MTRLTRLALSAAFALGMVATGLASSRAGTPDGRASDRADEDAAAGTASMPPQAMGMSTMSGMMESGQMPCMMGGGGQMHRMMGGGQPMPGMMGGNMRHGMGTMPMTTPAQGGE